MVKHLPFKLPNLQPLSDKSDITRWTRMCTKNRTSIMVWNSRFFPKISDGEPKYEYRYNIKAVHISLEDLQYLKTHLHPDDYRRYAPVGDSKVEKGMCTVYMDELYKLRALRDNEAMDDREYELMEKENEWLST